MRHTPTSERSAVVHPLVPQKSIGPIPYLLFYKRHMEVFSQNVLCARCVHTLLHHFHPEVFWSIFSITICMPQPTEKSYYGNICTDYMLWTFPIGLQILMHNTRGLCWCVAPPVQTCIKIWLHFSIHIQRLDSPTVSSEKSVHKDFYMVLR